MLSRRERGQIFRGWMGICIDAIDPNFAMVSYDARLRKGKGAFEPSWTVQFQWVDSDRGSQPWSHRCYWTKSLCT
jgi:hypothetical protein